MRNLIIYLGALSALSSPSSAVRHGAAQLRDLLAYPKYEVQFLNDLPVSVSDADKAKSLGVEREDEWLHLRLGLHDRKRLSDGQDAGPSEDRLRLVPMALTPPRSAMQADYLCLMPSANSTDSQTARVNLDEHVELDPVQSWAALSHLDGKCLYSKQGWFTYSYCHNSHIRQFREARHKHPHPPGGYEPEEDSTFDAYTLGQAHAAPPSRRAPPRKGSAGSGSGSGPSSPQARDHTPSISNPSVSFAESASSRYLVQRWSDGTTCDKTGQPREIEVQVHCSMTTTDVIYLVKEMAICQYVLIIHSPHLCGLPGFRAPHADVQPAGIRCRQVIADEEFEGWANRASDGGDVGDAGPLGLPWQLTRPVGGREGVQVEMQETAGGAVEGQSGHSASGSASGDGADGGDTLDYEMDELDLQQFLLDALSEYASGEGNGEATGDGTMEEFMLLSLEEDEEGNYVIDTDLLGGEGAKLKAVEGDERELLLKAVKRYLESKPQVRRDQVDGADGAGTDETEEAVVDRPRDEL